MANEGNDQLLMRVAILGITFSIICTMGLTLMLDYGGDYDYDTIRGYRQDLIEFSGESMINQTPWVLTHVYTPWLPSDGIEGHLDDDGWLYGEEIADYPYLNQSANIKLDVNQKSTVPITVSEESPEYSFVDGLEWWADNPIDFITRPIGEFFRQDPYTYATGNAGIWNYTGERFVFDPTLPFSQGTSSKDGSLSIVWYAYNGQEGLSGGLQIYGGGDVLLASYSASDIVADYMATNAYATTYDFNFEGVPLTLSIRFDAEVIENGTPLMSAFSQGLWSMAISSVSAGNFLDVENSNSFAATAGGMVDTFVKIYTWDLPQISNPWAMTVIWLMVGLPMTIAMLCVTLRVMSSIPIIGRRG